MTVIGLLLFLLVAVIAYFIITRFITDPGAQKIALIVVGVLLLVVLLGSVLVLGGGESLRLRIR